MPWDAPVSRIDRPASSLMVERIVACRAVPAAGYTRRAS
jgi:hypothetical protein